MRILFDQGTPAPLRRHLCPHPVDTTAERGWPTISNSDLLKCAEEDGYDVFVTTDQSIRYQQNLTGRRIGIVVLMATSCAQQPVPEIIAQSATRSAVATRKSWCDLTGRDGDARSAC